LEVWCYTDRLSYAPGDIVRFHVTTTVAEFDLEIVRDGKAPETVHRADGVAGAMHETPIDCSVNGCGWPVAYEFTLPDDWRSGVYIVRSYARRDGQTFDHRHMFILRPAAPGRHARMVMVCATGTWMAYNEWGGSNHYEGITGPNNDEFSTRLSIHRPWSRGFVWLPKGAPRIALAEPPKQNATVRYPHMEWAYSNGYSKKYASAGWASYERNFAVWAESQGYALDIIAGHDLPDHPDMLKACGSDSTLFGYEGDGLDYTFRHGLPYPTGDDGAPGGIETIAMGLATLVEDNHGHEGVVQFLEDLDARFIAATLRDSDQREGGHSRGRLQEGAAGDGLA
jgi:hypothetical protein